MFKQAEQSSLPSNNRNSLHCLQTNGTGFIAFKQTEQDSQCSNKRNSLHYLQTIEIVFTAFKQTEQDSLHSNKRNRIHCIQTSGSGSNAFKTSEICFTYLKRDSLSFISFLRRELAMIISFGIVGYPQLFLYTNTKSQTLLRWTLGQSISKSKINKQNSRDGRHKPWIIFLVFCCHSNTCIPIGSVLTGSFLGGRPLFGAHPKILARTFVFTSSWLVFNWCLYIGASGSQHTLFLFSIPPPLPSGFPNWVSFSQSLL